jgi:molecular chaperone DnaK
MAKDNVPLGKFDLDGIPPAPRGVPQIEVTFDIDANGILNVSAKDKATGRQQSIRIEASSGLKEDDIKKMVHDAEEHSAEDKKRREEADVKNRADQMVFETEKNLAQAGPNLQPDVKARVEAAVARVKEAVKSNNIDEMRSATEALTQVWHEAASQMYARASQQSGPQPGAGGPGAPGSDGGQTGPQPGSRERKEGDAVDADFEVVE